MTNMTWQTMDNKYRAFLMTHGVSAANILKIVAKTDSSSPSLAVISQLELSLPANSAKYLVVVLADSNINLKGGKEILVAATASEWIRLANSPAKDFVDFVGTDLRLKYTQGVRVSHQSYMKAEAGVNPNFLFQLF